MLDHADIELRLLTFLAFLTKEECVKGNDASAYWATAFKIDAILRYIKSNNITEDATIETKLNCLYGEIPPTCYGVPSIPTSSTTCTLSVGLEMVCDMTGNPCDNFSIELIIV